MSSKINELTKLIKQLNTYRDSYYNDSVSLVSDYEYDLLLDKLTTLEKETGIVLSNSPTQTVGYEVKSKLKKVAHNHPMLSLDKTKNSEDMLSFFGKKAGLLMHKMDGLTISIRYVNGKLVSAETRGNGEEGEDITHNAVAFLNVPLSIPCKDEVVIDGEAIITLNDFEKINRRLIDTARQEAIINGLSGESLDKYVKDHSYKNPRNLASGSVRQLDSAIAKKRNLRFIAWKIVKGCDDNSFINRLEWAKSMGFKTVDFVSVSSTCTKSELENLISGMQKLAADKRIPIDGLVASYDDVEYGDSLGSTRHHVRSQLAFKFYDEEFETVVRKIDWTMGKTGVLTPTAVFDPVEIDDTTVTRASVHNVSIMKFLKLKVSDRVRVRKANQIIPQITENISALAGMTVFALTCLKIALFAEALQLFKRKMILNRWYAKTMIVRESCLANLLTSCPKII